MQGPEEPISDAVREYMQRDHPAAWAIIEQAGCKTMRIQRGERRMAIRFVGVPVTADYDFDRSVEHDEAMIVVTGSPEMQLTLGRPATAKRADMRKAKLGDVLGCDPAFISPLCSPKLKLDDPPRRTATVTVLQREDFNRKLRLDDGQEFTMDVDEMAVFAPEGFWELQ